MPILVINVHLKVFFTNIIQTSFYNDKSIFFSLKKSNFRTGELMIDNTMDRV